MIFDDLNFVETIQDVCGINWTDKATMLCYDTFFLGAIKYISDAKSIGEGKLIASPKIPQKYDYALVKVALNLDDDDDDRISLSDGHSRLSKRRRTASAEDREEYSVADDANNSTTTILVKLLLFFGMSRFENEEHGGDTEKTHLFCIVQELYPIAKKNLMKGKNKRTSKIKERSADILLGKPFQWACHPRI